MNDSKRTLDTVPKNVTVTLKYLKDGSVDTVGSAYKELQSKTVEAQVKARKDPSVDAARAAYDGLRNKSVVVDVKGKSSAAGALSWSEWSKQFAPGISASASAKDWEKYISAAKKRYNQYLSGWKGFASGGFFGAGFTGRGNKHEEKGVIHGGEFVIPSQHVNQSTGVPNLSALGFMFNSMSMPPKSSASSSGSNNSIQLVELLPNQLKAIVDASKVLVNLDLETITSGVNAQNAQNNMRGSR